MKISTTTFWWTTACLLFMLSAAPTAVAEDSADDDDPLPFTWSCDGITPNLCSNLSNITGSVTTRKGLKIQYWKYFVADDNDSDHKDKKQSTDKGLPLLLINGGPGAAHNYNLPLRQLACDGAHSAVIFYDQGGNGESSIPKDASLDDYPFVLDIDYLGGEELQSVIDAAIISEDKDAKFHMVSDSFGTMVALQYVLNYHENEDRNKHIQSLVLNGPIPSSKELTDRAWDPKTGTIGTMPAYFVERYKSIMEKEDFDDNPEFESMERTLFTIFTYRSSILADCFLESFMGGDHEIYQRMWGVSEFIPMSGTLASFDVYPALEHFGDGGLLPPTLLTYGEFDEIREGSIFKLNDLWKKAGGYAEYHMFRDSGHSSIGDATAELILKTGDFLKRVEDKMVSVEDNSYGDSEDDQNKTNNQGLWIFITGIFVGCLIGILAGFQISRSDYRRVNQYQQVNDAVETVNV